jgi:hypothetical protein
VAAMVDGGSVAEPFQCLLSSTTTWTTLLLVFFLLNKQFRQKINYYYFLIIEIMGRLSKKLEFSSLGNIVSGYF